jgi:hypothetical protein
MVVVIPRHERKQHGNPQRYCSDIIVRMSDGTWSRIYCHWDGYLSHNGAILFKHYNTQGKREALIALGGLSSLGPTLGAKHDSSERNNPNVCTAYHRDGGEDLDIVTGPTLESVWPENDTWTEFTYVWNGDRWLVGKPKGRTPFLVDLGEALKADADTDTQA